MNQKFQETNKAKPEFFVDFNAASPATVKSILRALIAEMEEAMARKRFATFDSAFKRLSPSTTTMI